MGEKSQRIIYCNIFQYRGILTYQNQIFSAILSFTSQKEEEIQIQILINLNWDIGAYHQYARDFLLTALRVEIRGDQVIM